MRGADATAGAAANGDAGWRRDIGCRGRRRGLWEGVEELGIRMAVLYTIHPVQHSTTKSAVREERRVTRGHGWMDRVREFARLLCVCLHYCLSTS